MAPLIHRIRRRFGDELIAVVLTSTIAAVIVGLAILVWGVVRS